MSSPIRYYKPFETFMGWLKQRNMAVDHITGGYDVLQLQLDYALDPLEQCEDWEVMHRV